MNTYLLTWNPQNWTWVKLREQAKDTATGISVREPWSCGNTRRIKSGERLFLLKQGPEPPKGIMASGVATSDVYEDRHWNDDRASQGETALFVNAEWQTILDPEDEPLLPISAFQHDGMPSVHWNTQKSGIIIPATVADLMEELWERHAHAVRDSSEAYSMVSSDPDEDEFPEGRILYRLHRTRERNARLVRQVKDRALQETGTLACCVCGFDFHAYYGAIGEDFIECHHTVPISEMEEGAVTKVSDMALVCSNCHRMLHRRRPWLRVADLRQLVARR